VADRHDIDEDAPIFAIAAAAELSGMHPQTLRQYDRLGLVVPARTQGGSRRYSLRHVAQLREVARMSSDGMSLPAIVRILELEERVRELHGRVQALEQRVQTELDNRPGAFTQRLSQRCPGCGFDARVAGEGLPDQAKSTVHLRTVAVVGEAPDDFKQRYFPGGTAMVAAGAIF